jgi:hypothetical protein
LYREIGELWRQKRIPKWRAAPMKMGTISALWLYDVTAD